METKIIAAIITAVAAIVAASIPVVVKARERLRTITSTAENIEYIAGKIDHSINQRPSTMSDRVDGLQSTLNSIRSVQQQHTTALSVTQEQEAAMMRDLVAGQRRDQALGDRIAATDEKLEQHLQEARGPIARWRDRRADDERNE